MDRIDILIEMFEQAGIKYDVDQSVNDSGTRSLDVYVYDNNDRFAIFKFSAYNESNLTDFKVSKDEHNEQ